MKRWWKWEDSAGRFRRGSDQISWREFLEVRRAIWRTPRWKYNIICPRIRWRQKWPPNFRYDWAWSWRLIETWLGNTLKQCYLLILIGYLPFLMNIDWLDSFLNVLRYRYGILGWKLARTCSLWRKKQRKVEIFSHLRCRYAKLA